jgi:hypothetical protein
MTETLAAGSPVEIGRGRSPRSAVVTVTVTVVTIFAVLNIIDLVEYVATGGLTYDIDSLGEAPHIVPFLLVWFATPLAYIAVGILAWQRRLGVAVALMAIPILNAVAWPIFVAVQYGVAELMAARLPFGLFMTEPDFSDPMTWLRFVPMSFELVALITIGLLCLFARTRSTSRHRSQQPGALMSTPSSIAAFCGSCGTPAQGASFCQRCGAAIGGGSSPSPAQPTSGSVAYSAPQSTNTMAVVAFILSFFVPIVGMVLGYMARGEIDRSGGRQGGRGLATAAIVLNWIWIVSIVLIAIISVSMGT